MSAYKIDKWTAVAIVVANMVGTGVFTSLGFQLADIYNAWSIIFLWLFGGLIALSGAFTYAEIGTALIKNGGEYNYLNVLYHPALGFVAGFVSVIVGFAAPIAAACVAFGNYFAMSLFTHPDYSVKILFSLLILIGVSGIHLLGIKKGSVFQKYITLLKILIMLIFAAAFFLPNANPDFFQWQSHQFMSDTFSSAFAVSLIYVNYAYSGWNAAAYVAADIDNPQKNLARSIIAGTLIVTFFYVLLNICFLYSTPVSALKENVEVGIISAQYIFGHTFGNVIGVLISFLLISTVSSMMMASPRVLAVMGEDFKSLSYFTKTNQYQSPYVAILIITALSAVMIITSTFKWLINFIGITLILFTLFTTFGIFILRRKKDYQPVYKMPLYPFLPIFFIAMNIWILVYVSINNFSALMVSLITILSGLVLYKLIARIK